MRTFVALLLTLSLAGAALAQEHETACTRCHGDADTFGEDGTKLVNGFKHGVHAEVGLSCHDCHGGNPEASADDMEAAMDPGFTANPYVGAPKTTDIPAFCGRCHSDPEFMKKFRPDPRIDQETEYWTSFHGKALTEGDTNVATCVSCHGVHGILRVTDQESPVYPTHVAKTCAGCHADPEHMKGYTLEDGRPLPVDQYDRWRRSVHAAALLDREDLSAPTCNDCHGNHGAAPPGLQSVAFVCGQCHGREADLFRASPKWSGFNEHNEFLAEAGAEGCATCHGTSEPQSQIQGFHNFTECSTCHQNHAVIRPTVALLGSLPDTPCEFCHASPSGPMKGLAEPAGMTEKFVKTRDGLMKEAQAQSLEGSELFDWLVDRALSLPNHTLTLADGEGNQTTLRPEFSRLFEKFRIGKTGYTYFDPAANQEVRAEVVQCSNCHSPEPEVADAPVGHETAQAFLEHMRQLTVTTASAERIILAARRGGVEVRGGLLDLDKAVDSQIELEVLVHTFSHADSGAFMAKHAEGIDHARAAITAGEAGLKELDTRRRGLKISLLFIALALVGLGLKIRQMSRGGSHVVKEQGS